MGCAVVLLLATMPTVRVDPDVELFSIIFRLAGHPEYNQITSRSPYARDVDKYFAQFKGHAAVKRARELRKTRDIAFDAVMSLAVHAKEDFSKRPVWLEKRWRLDEAVAFLKLVRKFQADSEFDKFAIAHEPLYARAAEKFEGTAKEHADLGWVDDFIGSKTSAKAVVILGLLNGSMNYGVRNSAGLTPVMGMYRWNEYVPEPEPQFVPLLIHELLHPYVNPLVDRYYEDMEEQAILIFFGDAARFRRQGYTTPRILMYETVVRAIVLARLVELDLNAERTAQGVDDTRRGFTWTADISGWLVHRLIQRGGTKPEKLMRHVVSRLRARKKTAPPLPRLLRREPSGELDPTVRELRFVFNEQMKVGTWSMMRDRGEPFPEIDGKIHYSKDGKTLIVPVRLNPNMNYRFWLNSTDNSDAMRGFMSERGMPLTPVHITLVTCSAAE